MSYSYVHFLLKKLMQDTCFSKFNFNFAKQSTFK